MPSLWFVVPAHGRAELARICLRQLRRTCDALTAEDIDASAVVVADDANLDTARELGFATVERDNDFLSRKFNDGIQFALDDRYNPRPADFVVPCGSDDWIDHRIMLDLPTAPYEVKAFRRAAFVNEDASSIVSCELDNEAGVGIRVYPRALMALMDYRPGDEDRKRACDTSMLVNVKNAYRAEKNAEVPIVYGAIHDWAIVDWKSRGLQLNSHADVTTRHRRASRTADPFDVLAEVYPAEALAEMQRHYETTGALVAA